MSLLSKPSVISKLHSDKLDALGLTPQIRNILAIKLSLHRFVLSEVLLIPPFAVVDNPLFNAFVRKIAESCNAAWYLHRNPYSLRCCIANRGCTIENERVSPLVSYLDSEP
jgi:hypothetical protein